VKAGLAPVTSGQRSGRPRFRARAVAKPPTLEVPPALAAGTPGGVATGFRRLPEAESSGTMEVTVRLGPGAADEAPVVGGLRNGPNYAANSPNEFIRLVGSWLPLAVMATQVSQVRKMLDLPPGRYAIHVGVPQGLIQIAELGFLAKRDRMYLDESLQVSL